MMALAIKLSVSCGTSNSTYLRKQEVSDTQICAYPYICTWLQWSLGYLKLSAVESLKRSVWALRSAVAVPWLIWLCSLMALGVRWMITACASWRRSLTWQRAWQEQLFHLNSGRNQPWKNWRVRAEVVPFPLDHSCQLWRFPWSLGVLPAVTGSPSRRCGASCGSWAWTAPVRTASSSRRCVQLFQQELPGSVGQGWLLLWRRRGRTEVWSACKSLWEQMGLCTSSIRSEYLGTSSLCCLLVFTVKTYLYQLSAEVIKNLRGGKDPTHFTAFCHFPFLAIGSKIVKSTPVTAGRLFSLGCWVNLILTVFW